jgi:hypothetical protein
MEGRSGGQAAHTSKSSTREGDEAALYLCEEGGDVVMLHLRDRAAESWSQVDICGHRSVRRCLSWTMT